MCAEVTVFSSGAWNEVSELADVLNAVYIVTEFAQGELSVVLSCTWKCPQALSIRAAWLRTLYVQVGIC
jgi:hypothetical protein